MNKNMQETRAFLESINMPGGDLYSLPTSEKRFPDGGQYRFEVPGIQGPGPMKALLEQLDEYGIQIHRVTQTKGIMFLTDEEISQMVELAKKYHVQLVLACGPRATTDTSASVKTEEGQRMGYQCARVVHHFLGHGENRSCAGDGEYRIQGPRSRIPSPPVGYPYPRDD